MLLTEEQAKEKWCPMVRTDFVAGTPFDNKPTCIGSACMAWRWMEPRGGSDAHGWCGSFGEPK